MKDLNYNELRHLLPSIREAIFNGRQRYDDQEGTVRLEPEWERRIARGEAVQTVSLGIRSRVRQKGEQP